MSNVGNVIPKKSILKLKDGTEYELFYSMFAFAQMEETHGTLEAALNYLSSTDPKGQIKRLIEFLELGLMHYDEPVDMKSVVKKLDIRDKDNLMRALVGAMQADSPINEIPKN